MQCPPLNGKVDRILTWRWKESKESREELASMTLEERKLRPKPTREFFVHWLGKSYWKCEWIAELQLEVFHPTMLRAYFKKNDLEEPPKLDEQEDQIMRRRKHKKEGVDIDPLDEKFYKFGVRPEWLQIQRIINHQTFRDGSSQYLVKWRDLTYDRVSWEEEDQDIPGFKEAIEKYNVSEVIVWFVRNKNLTLKYCLRAGIQIYCFG